MERDRRIIYPKRKPLSDCTNLIPNSNLTKPPKKPTNFNTNNNVNTKKRKNENPPRGVIITDGNIGGGGGGGGEAKSHTSTGSNNSPGSDCGLSQPPAPPTPVSDPGGRDRRKSGTAVGQTQRQDEQTRQDRGKVVADTPNVKASVVFKSQAVQISSSVVSGKGDYVAGPPTANNSTLDAQRRNDKGKNVVETPIIQITVPVTSHAQQQSSSSAASGNDRYFSGPSAADNHTLDAQTRKDKGKKVIETPVIDISVPVTYYTQKKSLLAASASDCYFYGSSSADNRTLDARTMKDKGNNVVETPAVHISAPVSYHTRQTSSLAVPGPSLVQIHKPDAQTRTDKGKMVRGTTNSEGSDPMTPHSLVVSASAASGTGDQGRSDLIVYNQRKAPQRKKHAGGSIILPYSCPPGKRIKNKGVELEGGGSGSHSGSHTDPLPLKKKKRSCKKHDDSIHAMPQDEVEKLKAYFADIDAFELPEEAASESELE